MSTAASSLLLRFFAVLISFESLQSFFNRLYSLLDASSRSRIRVYAFCCEDDLVVAGSIWKQRRQRATTTTRAEDIFKYLCGGMFLLTGCRSVTLLTPVPNSFLLGLAVSGWCLLFAGILWVPAKRHLLKDLIRPHILWGPRPTELRRLEIFLRLVLFSLPPPTFSHSLPQACPPFFI